MCEVSVVVPTYKRTNLLRVAIDSVIDQTFVDYEIIVVNDCDEESESVKNMFMDDKYKCVKIINNYRKKGANGARNSGILISKGKYIAFLDDDDYWYKDKLFIQHKIISEFKTFGAVICGYRIGQKIEKHVDQDYILNDIDVFDLLTYKKGLGSSSTIMIKKEVFNNIGLWDEDLQRFQDLELIVRFFKKYKLLNIDKCMVVIPYGNQGLRIKHIFNSLIPFLFKINKNIDYLNGKKKYIIIFSQIKVLVYYYFNIVIMYFGLKK